MAKDNNPSAIPYEILRVEDQFGTDDTGRLVEVKAVYYRSAFGDTGVVKIPKLNFAAEAVRVMIEAELDEIRMLRG